MKTKIIFFSIYLILIINSLKAEVCNIYIHGYTGSTGKNYFGNLPHQVQWNSSLEIPEAALEVANGILKEIETCPENSDLILRPHSYGASQVAYILGQGKRFENLYPEHPFVKIYQSTMMVISYTGAYHGTPLMDMVCSGAMTEALGELIDKPCVMSLTTSTQFDVTYYISTPAIPTYLIYSTSRSGFLGISGQIIARHGLTHDEFYRDGKRNQNDNTLPISSTMACESTQPITDAIEPHCKNLDSNYFINLYHEKKYNHLNFKKNEKYMSQEVGDFLNES